MLQRLSRSPWLAVFALLMLVPSLQAQVLPLDQKNTINGDWLVQVEESNRLVPYIAREHASYNAVHQWVSMTPAQPFLIDFAAKQGLCIYLNNKVIFIADSTATYTVDLAVHGKDVSALEGRYLLTAWHPLQQPLLSSFKNHIVEPDMDQKQSSRSTPFRFRNYVNQNAFVLFMLLIGLIYGGLKANYTTDFKSIYNPGDFFRSGTPDEGNQVRPIRSWSGILFVLAFSLSLALLIVAIHTNAQQIQLFSRLFPVSEADITTRILFYTLFVFAFILIKYLFLKVMGFIFELDEVVQFQYNEFVRTILFLGILLPFVMLLYLSLNTAMPKTVLLVSSLAVSFLLILTTIRVFIKVNKKVGVLNLHLFSYLCATEVIPLAIVLKLIVF